MSMREIVKEIVEINKTVKHASIKVSIDYKILYIGDNENEIHFGHMTDNAMESENIGIDAVAILLNDPTAEIKFYLQLKNNEIEIYGKKILATLEKLQNDYPDYNIRVSSRIIYN